jgi:hypothetical protein
MKIFGTITGMSEYIEQVRREIGQLVRDQMDTKGLTLRSVTEAMGDTTQPKTLQHFIDGKTNPHPSTLRKLEAAIGWQDGIITEVLIAARDQRIEESLTLAYMRIPAYIRDADDVDLLDELTVRIDRWRQKLASPAAGVTVLRPVGDAEKKPVRRAASDTRGAKTSRNAPVTEP